MVASRIVWWSGPLLMLGGVLWAAWPLVHNLQPTGCVADECSLPGYSMRQGSALGTALMLAAVLVLAAGVAGLVLRARAGGRFGKPGHAGLGVIGVGLATLVSAGVIQAVFFDGDFWAMPYFVIPGGLAVVVGCALLGLAILRAGLLPRWGSALLIVGTLVMLGMNEQNAQVLLAIPFGVAWAVIGFLLWSLRGGLQTTVAVGQAGSLLPPHGR